jgi:hypothetical protein
MGICTWVILRWRQAITYGIVKHDSLSGSRSARQSYTFGPPDANTVHARLVGQVTYLVVSFGPLDGKRRRANFTQEPG